MFVPLIAGISYEVLKWAGSSESLFVKIISYPGMALQKWTTVEPMEEQIEVAIKSLEEVLEDDKEQ